jgi:hypothetical protein
MRSVIGAVAGHLRDRWVGVIAVAAFAGGLFALLSPIMLDAYDPWGVQIGCGSAYSRQLHQAEVADQTPAAATDYVGECSSAVAHRRAWTLPVLCIGAVIEAVDVVMWARSGPLDRALRAAKRGWSEPPDDTLHEALNLDRRERSHLEHPLDTAPTRHSKPHGPQRR